MAAVSCRDEIDLELKQMKLPVELNGVVVIPVQIQLACRFGDCKLNRSESLLQRRHFTSSHGWREFYKAHYLYIAE